MSGEVPAQTVRELIALATMAPCHHLTEPWHFTVITGSARERLGRLWAERAATVVDIERRAAFIEGESQKPLRAPTLIIVSTRTDANAVTAEEDFAATAAAVQTLLIAAESLGIQAGWKTGKMVHDAAVKEFLGLDSTDRIVATIYLGTKALEQATYRPRKVDELVTWMTDAAGS
jgi:nitroreductase